MRQFVESHLSGRRFSLIPFTFMKPLLASFLLVLAIAAIAICQPRAGNKFRNTEAPGDISREGSVAGAKLAHQGFNMKVWINNQLVAGLQSWNDPGGIPPEEPCYNSFGLLYPTDGCIEHLFAAAPLIGAMVDGTRRVSEGYNTENGGSDFVPSQRDTARERIWKTSLHTSGEPNRKGVDDDGDGKIDEDELDGLDNDGDWSPLTDDVGSDGIPDMLEIGCTGTYDPVKNPDPAFDNYEPTKRDSCRPDILGNFPFKRD